MSYNIESLVRLMITHNNNNINISFPAVIVNVDKLKDNLVDVKPLVNYQNTTSGGYIEYPTITDVSLVFPSSQTSTICFPVNQGDFVDLVFQSSDIQRFISGNTSIHNPKVNSFGNLTNVVAFIGFTPFQQSCFNPINYTNDFDNQDLNIVHNKGSENEITFKLTSEGDLKVLNAKKVSYECEEFEIKASEKIKFTAPLISENGR